MKQFRLPDYPRIAHLPHNANVTEGDITAEMADIDILFDGREVWIEEKIDGANCAMMLVNGNPVIRNRSNLLKKGYLKDTPAKLQFRSIWNWFYEHKAQFEELNKMFGGPVGLYGEWLYALHGIRYERLPSYFIGFEIYDPERKFFYDSASVRLALLEIGFSSPQLLHKGPLESVEQIVTLLDHPSQYSSIDPIEGLFLKISKDQEITHRFKMIRPDYQQGSRWNPEKIQKQTLK